MKSREADSFISMQKNEEYDNAAAGNDDAWSSSSSYSRASRNDEDVPTIIDYFSLCNDIYAQ